MPVWQKEEQVGKRKLVITLSMIILVLLLTSPAAAAPHLYKLTGGGTTYFEGWGKETYAISARQIDEDGNARGQVQLTWHYPEVPGEPSPWIMHADVLYLTVNPDTGDAWVGGVITKSNYYYYEGVEFYLQVRDGGKGSTDQIGYTYLGWPAVYALYMPSGAMFEFTHGGFQLK